LTFKLVRDGDIEELGSGFLDHKNIGFKSFGSQLLDHKRPSTKTVFKKTRNKISSCDMQKSIVGVCRRDIVRIPELLAIGKLAVE
jgi:hypothetical protein